MMSPELSRRFARFINSRLVETFPIDERMRIREVLINTESLENLPADVLKCLELSEREPE
ncbi:MAG: hypothetical protein M0Q91_17165 [Methanoregula sp.]|jgi:hypothetical protein|nr:hypothetical protein [Methanoregula sp.]